MAKRRLSMRKIKEVLRLKWDHNLSNRQIATSCSISHSTVKEYLLRAKLDGPSFRPCGHSGAFGLTACSDERHYGGIVQNNEAKKEDEPIFIRV